jgi:ribonuclease-3
MQDYAELESRLGCTFKNKLLLMEALTHRSYINENKRHEVPHNERLEFLGDAVLQMSVTEHLFKKFPEKREGELTKIRSYYVKGERAYETVLKIDLNAYMFLSRGEQKDARARKVILADAFEAVIGAIYLDQGMEKANEVIKRLLLPEKMEVQNVDDSKSMLQEQVQEKVGVTPRYQLIQESGPDHDKVFEVGVYIGAALTAKGTGPSKMSAEKAAAAGALKLLAK